MAVVLVGDVGGTNTRLQLYRVSAAGCKNEVATLVSEAKLPSQTYATFRDAVADFLAGKEAPTLAAIGIAGPVSNNRCKITNVLWPEIVGEELAEAFHMREFRLMNDFEAAGYGVLDLKPTDMEDINNPELLPEVPSEPHLSVLIEQQEAAGRPGEYTEQMRKWLEAREPSKPLTEGDLREQLEAWKLSSQPKTHWPPTDQEVLEWLKTRKECKGVEEQKILDFVEEMKSDGQIELLYKAIRYPQFARRPEPELIARRISFMMSLSWKDSEQGVREEPRMEEVLEELRKEKPLSEGEEYTDQEMFDKFEELIKKKNSQKQREATEEEALEPRSEGEESTEQESLRRSMEEDASALREIKTVIDWLKKKRSIENPSIDKQLPEWYRREKVPTDEEVLEWLEMEKPLGQMTKEEQLEYLRKEKFENGISVIRGMMRDSILTKLLTEPEQLSKTSSSRNPTYKGKSEWFRRITEREISKNPTENLEGMRDMVASKYYTYGPPKLARSVKPHESAESMKPHESARSVKPHESARSVKQWKNPKLIIEKDAPTDRQVIDWLKANPKFRHLEEEELLEFLEEMKAAEALAVLHMMMKQQQLPKRRPIEQEILETRLKPELLKQPIVQKIIEKLTEKDPQEMARKPKAVIGIGTGVGECILTAHNGEYVVWPGEGGHCDFFPKTDIDYYYADHILKEVNKPDSPYEHFRPIDNITVELAIGGIVLHHLYPFFKTCMYDSVNPEFDKLFESKKTNEEKVALTFEYGFSGRDEICQKGVQHFLRILGNEAGNMAAKTLCYGGLYLIGGVVQKNLEAIKKEGTLKAEFLSKPVQIRSILNRVPLYLVTYEDVGLLGALHCAKKLLAANPPRQP